MPFFAYIYMYIGTQGPEIASNLLKIEKFSRGSPKISIAGDHLLHTLLLATLGLLAGRNSLFEIASAGS